MRLDTTAFARFAPALLIQTRRKPCCVAAGLIAASITVCGCGKASDNTYSTDAKDAKPVEATPADVTAETTTLALNGENTTVEWTGSKPGGSKHDGGFKELTGTATLSGDALTKLQATIDINSMWSDADKLTAHLLNADFFNAPEHPESEFVSTEIRPVQADDATGPIENATHMVTGNFTLRGVTKSITFPAVVDAAGESLTFDTTFNIDRGQFGMDYGLADAVIHDAVVIRLKLDVPKA